MNRIDREKKTLRQMVGLYCRHKEKQPMLCARCEELLAYAFRRLDSCRFGQKKRTCQHCQVYCYVPAYRTRIREVMRYAGPRMLFFHPLAALRHLLKEAVDRR